jgi:hypothetical protein
MQKEAFEKGLPLMLWMKSVKGRMEDCDMIRIAQTNPLYNDIRDYLCLMENQTEDETLLEALAAENMHRTFPDLKKRKAPGR